MDEKKNEFTINDVSLATFLNNHGSKMIEIKNGKYIFEYDDTIEENLKLYEDTLKKCMF